MAKIFDCINLTELPLFPEWGKEQIFRTICCKALKKNTIAGPQSATTMVSYCVLHHSRRGQLELNVVTVGYSGMGALKCLKTANFCRSRMPCTK